MVVAGRRADKPWQGRLFDLRVDDHPDPVAEIARVLRVKRAQNAQSRFVGAATAGQMEEAIHALREATEPAPESGETPPPAAMACSFQGRPEAARTAPLPPFATTPP